MDLFCLSSIEHTIKGSKNDKPRIENNKKKPLLMLSVIAIKTQLEEKKDKCETTIFYRHNGPWYCMQVAGAGAVLIFEYTFYSIVPLHKRPSNSLHGFNL